MTFPDHFSGHAGEYSRYRPRYPSGLFEFLATESPRRELAWDCATGSGQAAVGLAGPFRRVIATDGSPRQLAHAGSDPRVHYVTALAEAAPLAAGSVDLITVAQALHWFRWEDFYAEVQRVCRPGGLIAAWAYGLFQCGPVLDPVVEEFYSLEVGAFWPPERRHIETGYRDVPFPFHGIPAPAFEMKEEWDLNRLLGYLRTWSAVRRCRQARGRDPVAKYEDRIRAAWGKDSAARLMRWKLHLLVGRVR